MSDDLKLKHPFSRIGRVNGDDLKFKHSFSCIVSGPCGSDKSSFCTKFLFNLKTLCTERNFYGRVIWCYSEKTALPKLKWNKIRFHEGVPSDFNNARVKPSLVILDNLLMTHIRKKCVTFFKKAATTEISARF